MTPPHWVLRALALALVPAFAALAVMAVAPPAGAVDLFVDAASGDDAADGLSWTTARATVGSALATAAVSPGADVVSVAEGTYPEHLVVPADTSLLGGFPAGGGPRDPAANPTILDGGGWSWESRGRVVHFPPGADGTLLEGFTIRGGYGDGAEPHAGGGILVEDAAPLIRGNVIEGNLAHSGSGVALLYTTARATARVVDNVVQRNGNLFARNPCERGSNYFGGGVHVEGPAGVDLGTILSGNRIVDNWACVGAGINFEGAGTVEHELLRGNLGLASVHLVGGPLLLQNVGVNGGSRAISVACGGTYRLENVTMAASGGLAVDGEGAGTDVQVVDSILWTGDTLPPWGQVVLGDFCGGPAPSIATSIVQGGYPGGTGILDADPLFTTGPLQGS